MFSRKKSRNTGCKALHVYFFLLIFLFRLVPGFAQYYNFRNYSVEEGLAQSQVYTVFQCSRGYLWCGMYGGGLSRFDGKNFKNYSTKDGLSDNVVYAIIEDRQGNLWMGTDIGVNKYDGKTFSALTEKDGLIQNSVRTLFQDREGRLWLGTYSGGLSCLKNGRFTHFTTAEGLTDNRIRSIIQDREGNLWIGTLKGLNKYDGNALVSCRVTRRLQGHQVFCVMEDPKGNLWFATNKGLLYFDGKTFTTYTTRDGLCDDSINYVFRDNSGYVWIATDNGVNQFDTANGTISAYTTREGLCHNLVESITQDREGNLWFATESGISKFGGKAFTYFSTREGLRSNMVWAVWEAPDGAIWLGTEKGISKYYEKESAIVSPMEKWTRGITYPFYEDRQGNLWFGTGKVIIKYDGRHYTNISETLRLEDYNVFSIIEDHQGNLWFGIEEHGAKKYDGKTFTGVKKEDGLLDNTVHVVLEDHRQNLWFGTSEGISIYNENTKHFINITTSEWLTNKYVFCILEDPDNSFWIGTYGGGVIQYTPPQENEKITGGDSIYTDGSIETFTTQDGLVDDEILLMIFDDNGNLWLGTNKGMGVLDIAEFKKRGKKIFKYYGKEDGFIGIECTQNSGYKDSRGNLWFGTIRGAIKYNPGEDKSNLVEPVVHISNVSLFFETDLGLPVNLELPYHQNHLTFDFIGISLAVPEKVKYQVKLEGFDVNWSPSSSTNFATYSNLPPGQYTFKVKACNNSGVWSKKPTVYRFRIKASFWMTWWFYILVAAAVIAGVLGFIKIRVRHLKRRQRILEEQVHLRTLELEKEKAKVEQINIELEQRVEERTRKLEIANKQLLHAQKMEAIGALAGGVAHDLNNVLAGIINYPELLLMDTPQGSPFRGHLLAIQRSGEKAAAIVQDLLTLARRGVNVAEVVNLNQVISEFMQSPELAKILSYHPNVQVETKLEENLLNIMGSPIHLFKVIMNLSSNAAEAMPEGGTFIISSENQYLTEPVNGYDEISQGDYVVLKVSDTGIGISSDDMERIFEPFYTKKRMGRSGTGLGMSVVWGTVKDHEGYIEVQSQEGKGTQLTLYFPATRQKPAKKESQPTIEEISGEGEAILVVDDVEDQREVTSLMLRQLGYAVCGVASGEEAVEFVKETPVDLLVLDMIMDPGMSGLETYKRILEMYPEQKAVIISGYSETEEIREAQQLGAGAYVKKPFDIEKIGLAVKKELKKEHSSQEGKL